MGDQATYRKFSQACTQYEKEGLASKREMSHRLVSYFALGGFSMPKNLHSLTPVSDVLITTLRVSKPCT